ncbi:MAG: TetR/AcrR family transcriptional regulator, partial [Bacteroidales bacterium]|nr:TetR/AcrR family transcriptional regulator [Bacteroidales bacterium]
IIKTITMELSIRSTILEKAKEVFSKYGYRKTTLDDIAGACGKGKSSLYYYFKNKEVIFEEVIRQEVDNLKNEFRTAMDSVKDPKEKLRIYIVLRMVMFRNLVNFFPTFRQEFMEYYSLIERIRASYDEEEFHIIKGILQYGIDCGEFKIRNITMTAHAIIKAMKGFEFPWAIDQDVRTMKKEIDSVLDVLFYGIMKR